MKYIAMTGSIGSGKSTVSEIFYKHYGINVISADSCARIVIKDKIVIQKIVENFGIKILDNQKINKNILRNIIVGNERKRIFLNELMHPRIRHILFNKAKESRSPYTIIDIPLLSKSTLKYYPYLKKVISVFAKYKIKIGRIMKRDNEKYSRALKMLKCQITDKERRLFSNFIIQNNTNKNLPIKQIEVVHQKILKYIGQQKK